MLRAQVPTKAEASSRRLSERPLPGSCTPSLELCLWAGNGAWSSRSKGYLVNMEAQDRGRICEPQASCSLLPLLPDTWEGLSYVAKYPQGQHQPVEMSVKPQT